MAARVEIIRRNDVVLAIERLDQITKNPQHRGDPPRAVASEAMPALSRLLKRIDSYVLNGQRPR